MKEENNYVSRKFETMLPLDVFNDFQEYTLKVTKTGLGKFDYGVALRSLLEKAKIIEAIAEIRGEIELIKERLSLLEKNPKEEEEVVTFRRK